MIGKHTYHYLTINGEIRNRSLFVLGGGTIVAPPMRPYPPVDHPQHHFFRWTHGRVLHEYQLVYVTRGSGLLETRSGGTRSIVSGDLFMLFPGEWHRYTPSECVGWDEHWVAFQGCRVKEMISELNLTISVPVFRTDVTDQLGREFVRIEEELSGESPGYQNVVAARIELILALAAASSGREDFNQVGASQAVKRAKTYINEKLDMPITMEDVAKELGLGYSSFRKTFREIAGISPGDYQMQVRISRACEYLRSSNLLISEIGLRCGFESSYYFSRVFRIKTGLSPSEYRAQAGRPD